jgi:hypothetical protein
MENLARAVAGAVIDDDQPVERAEVMANKGLDDIGFVSHHRYAVERHAVSSISSSVASPLALCRAIRADPGIAIEVARASEMFGYTRTSLGAALHRPAVPYSQRRRTRQTKSGRVRRKA